jgi:hypothetical protein
MARPERISAIVSQNGNAYEEGLGDAWVAEAYRRDNPNATVQFLDTGHFALETHVE